jgi:hypothetical protein
MKTGEEEWSFLFNVPAKYPVCSSQQAHLMQEQRIIIFL